MRYEADCVKAASNLAKHSVAFDAVVDFDFRTALIRMSISGEGPRLEAFGLIGDRLHCLVYSVENGLRVISLRKANKREVLTWISER